MTHSLSLMLPVFDGAAYLEGSLEGAWRWLEGRGGGELIVVDDGSTDATPEIIARFGERARGRGTFVALRNEENRGKGFSVRRGLLHARGDVRLFTDADLTYPIASAEHVVAALEGGADLAVACRVHEESRYLVAPDFFRYIYTRHNAGRLFNALVRALLVRGLRDTQAGLKGFRAPVVEALFPRLTRDRFSFDVELLYLAQRHGYRIDEVPVTYVYFKEPSTIHFARDTVSMCRDLLSIRARAARGDYDRDAAGRPADGR